MASSSNIAAPHDDFDIRFARIRRRLLDGIEETLDELAHPETRRAAIAGALRSRVAPLICAQATCRRARRCRRNPCKAIQGPAATDNRA